MRWMRIGGAADRRRLLRDRVEDGLEIAGSARERVQGPGSSGELLAESRRTRVPTSGAYGPGGMWLSGATPCTLLREAAGAAILAPPPASLGAKRPQKSRTSRKAWSTSVSASRAGRLPAGAAGRSDQVLQGEPVPISPGSRQSRAKLKNDSLLSFGWIQ